MYNIFWQISDQKVWKFATDFNSFIVKFIHFFFSTSLIKSSMLRLTGNTIFKTLILLPGLFLYNNIMSH